MKSEHYTQFTRDKFANPDNRAHEFFNFSTYGRGRGMSPRWLDPNTFSPINKIGGYYYLCKRLLDLFLIIWALPFLLPLMLIIAVMIKLDSKGPVIYSQKRVGARRKKRDKQTYWEKELFSYYKFRTIQVNLHQENNRNYPNGYKSSDKSGVANLQPGNRKPQAHKAQNDPQVTRVGNYLREWGLEELPQIINVIKGDMSLVGPRPAYFDEVEANAPKYWERLTAQPGLTGLSQVSRRNSTSLDELVELDIEYIKKQSIWLDLKILFLTITTLISK